MDETLNEVLLEVFEARDMLISDDMSPDNVPGWDSLRHINLINSVEGRFNIRFKNKELAKLRNIGDLRRLLKAYLSSSDTAITEVDPAILHILLHCGGLEKGERVAVIGDGKTAELAKEFAREAKRNGAGEITLEIGDIADIHGQEPNPAAAAAMLQADLVVGLTWMSLAHTNARLAAAERGARYLSLPQYDRAMLSHPAVMVDYRSLAGAPLLIARALKEGHTARIRTPGGTSVAFDISNRDANFCPGYLNKFCRLASPPDIETNIAPTENGTNGTFVVDGSVAVADIGAVVVPFAMHIESGRCTCISGGDGDIAVRVKHLFEMVDDDRSRIVGELGFGFNPLAEPCGNMLLDEGAMGCVHLGFGSNLIIGGCNATPFHLDFIARNVTLEIDGRVHIRDGKIEL
jgi:leucyl aminopeptidase (aminopeptidase T)/acyl carrier protein